MDQILNYHQNQSTQFSNVFENKLKEIGTVNENLQTELDIVVAQSEKQEEHYFTNTRWIQTREHQTMLL